MRKYHSLEMEDLRTKGYDDVYCVPIQLTDIAERQACNFKVAGMLRTPPRRQQEWALQCSRLMCRLNHGIKPIFAV